MNRTSDGPFGTLHGEKSSTSFGLFTAFNLSTMVVLESAAGVSPVMQSANVAFAALSWRFGPTQLVSHQNIVICGDE